MRQTAEVTVERFRSVCCQATIDPALFSDGRRFLICSACGKVLAVEPKREHKRDYPAAS
jgi:hypothetical protein